MSVPSCAVWHVFLHRPANELGVHRQWKLSNQVNVIPLLASLLAERRSATCAPPLVRAKCDAGEKGLECARNCQNADHPCVSLACVPGCLCPPGTVGCGSFMHAIYTVFSLLILFFILIVSIYCFFFFKVWTTNNVLTLFLKYWLRGFVPPKDMKQASLTDISG